MWYGVKVLIKNTHTHTYTHFFLRRDRKRLRGEAWEGL